MPHPQGIYWTRVTAYYNEILTGRPADTQLGQHFFTQATCYEWSDTEQYVTNHLSKQVVHSLGRSAVGPTNLLTVTRSLSPTQNHTTQLEFTLGPPEPAILSVNRHFITRTKRSIRPLPFLPRLTIEGYHTQPIGDPAPTQKDYVFLYRKLREGVEHRRNTATR